MHYTQINDQFNTIANKLMIIFGIIMCIFGLIGNILNILIFTIWSRSRKISNKSNQTNNSPLYLLASSISNLFIITYPLLTRIMFDGYQYRVTQTNVFILCKLRYYILHTFDLISLTCICLAIFDRYLISSRKVHLRQLSPTKKRTKLIILFLISLIGLHSIPLALYFDVSNTGQCIIISIIYSHYYLYIFQICLHGLIPILFLSIFGILTVNQLKLLKQHNPYSHLNTNRQLSRMLLLTSIAIILSSIPNCIERIYIIFVNNNDEHSSRFFLYHVISSILFYTNPVTSFYIFYITTPNFRFQLRNLCQTNRHINYLVPNQIHSRISIQK